MRDAEVAAELTDVHSQIGQLLSSMGSAPDRRDYLEYRAQLGRLQASFDELNNTLSKGLGMTSAKARMLAYLELHVGEVVTNDELAGVAGIFEFQRRLRELRQDDGYDLSSMETHAGLRPGEYILVSKGRTVDEPTDWDRALQVRSRSLPAGAALGEFLRLVHPRSVATSLLRFVIDGADLDTAVVEACDCGYQVERPEDSNELRLAGDDCFGS